MRILLLQVGKQGEKVQIVGVRSQPHYPRRRRTWLKSSAFHVIRWDTILMSVQRGENGEGKVANRSWIDRILGGFFQKVWNQVLTYFLPYLGHITSGHMAARQWSHMSYDRGTWVVWQHDIVGLKITCRFWSWFQICDERGWSSDILAWVRRDARSEEHVMCVKTQVDFDLNIYDGEEGVTCSVLGQISTN